VLCSAPAARRRARPTRTSQRLRARPAPQRGVSRQRISAKGRVGLGYAIWGFGSAGPSRLTIAREVSVPPCRVRGERSRSRGQGGGVPRKVDACTPPRPQASFARSTPQEEGSALSCGEESPSLKRCGPLRVVVDLKAESRLPSPRENPPTADRLRESVFNSDHLTIIRSKARACSTVAGTGATASSVARAAFALFVDMARGAGPLRTIRALALGASPRCFAATQQSRPPIRSNRSLAFPESALWQGLPKRH